MHFGDEDPTYALNTTFCSCEDGADEAEVLCAAPTRFAHLFESLS